MARSRTPPSPSKARQPPRLAQHPQTSSRTSESCSIVSQDDLQTPHQQKLLSPVWMTRMQPSLSTRAPRKMTHCPVCVHYHCLLVLRISRQQTEWRMVSVLPCKTGLHTSNGHTWTMSRAVKVSYRYSKSMAGAWRARNLGISSRDPGSVKRFVGKQYCWPK